MKRFGMVCRLKADRIDEYKRLHAAVWPEVLDKIGECNLQNYSIFLKDDLLFSYFEYTGENFEADMRDMEKDPATQRWWDVCKPCMDPLETRAEGEWWAEMEEIFHT